MTNLADQAVTIAQREYCSQRAVQDGDNLPDHLRHQWPDLSADYRNLLVGCVLAGMAHVGGMA